MAQVKRMRSVANGNRTFITDFTSIANALFSAIAGLPFANNNFCISRAVVNGGSAPSITINRYGGVFMRNKFFGTADDGVLSIPQGWYLYAVGELDTTQPRTSTTGASYSQNYVYYLVASQTAQTGLATDYDALTGKWEIINGATTAAMTTDAYVSWGKNLVAPWGWGSLPGALPADFVTSDELADGAVIASKVADGAITSRKLGYGAVDVNAMGNNAVTQSAVGSNTVGNRSEARYQLGVSSALVELRYCDVGYFNIPQNPAVSSAGVTINWESWAPISVVHVFVDKKSSAIFTINFDNTQIQLPAAIGVYLIHVSKDAAGRVWASL